MVSVGHRFSSTWREALSKTGVSGYPWKLLRHLGTAPPMTPRYVPLFVLSWMRSRRTVADAEMFPELGHRSAGIRPHVAGA